MNIYIPQTRPVIRMPVISYRVVGYSINVLYNTERTKDVNLVHVNIYCNIPFGVKELERAQYSNMLTMHRSSDVKISTMDWNKIHKFAENCAPKRLIVAQWRLMATEIWVNIGSCNGLLPDGTKPLPEPMLTWKYFMRDVPTINR